MGKLVIVSNRLPITVRLVDGRPVLQPSVGGLATGLAPFHQSQNSVWVGWPGVDLEEVRDAEAIQQELREHRCYPVFLSRREFVNYYQGFSNNTLWPLFHYFVQYTIYRNDYWQAYKKVNQAFCETVLKIAEETDTIWVHDYHLLLLPKLLRDRLPEANIGFFLHIPFPSSEVFRLLPWREEILEGMLGADLIGFHTYDYARHFLTSVRRLLGYDQFFTGKLVISVRDRVVRVDVFPMGIDFDRFASMAAKPEVQSAMREIRARVGDRRVILSVDRLDYTKGLIERLDAYDLFLERYPEYREKVVLIIKVVESRTGIKQYEQIKRTLDEAVGRINRKYGTISWTPILYLGQFLPETDLVALYALADVALITPLRDGMNLIAKEFLATKTEGRGVLILSELAGAANELREALIVNPNNREQIAEAIKTALTMPEEEQKERNRVMRKRLQRYNVVRWAEDFLEGLATIKKLQKMLATKHLTGEIKARFLSSYRQSQRRLLLLDYDGTLVPFSLSPAQAVPDPELMEILERLTQEKKNEVVIVSGRKREVLETWFGHLGVGLVAEHGAWIKERWKDWQTIEPLDDSWKEEIRRVLELYVERTPGSFVEEKTFSLVWHYRRVDREFGEVRVGELKETLLQLTGNLNLEILEGDKLIEVRPVGISKGRAVGQWLLKEKWDLILAVGDDRTDEDMFAVLPEESYTVKVGIGPSRARFRVFSPWEVRGLLKEMAQ